MQDALLEASFVGALAYADDIVLLAPTASAMRRMLNICEEYASHLPVLFNASKSKGIVCQSRRNVNILLALTAMFRLLLTIRPLML